MQIAKGDQITGDLGHGLSHSTGYSIDNRCMLGYIRTIHKIIQLFR